MTLEEFHSLTVADAVRELLRCCGARRWAMRMALGRPYRDFEAVMRAADAYWDALDVEDRLEALRAAEEADDVPLAPPRSRRELARLKNRTAAERLAKGAGPHLVGELASLLSDYERRFGYPFVICAAGKSGEEVAVEARKRLRHSRDQEFVIACAEAAALMRIRLGALLREAAP